MGRGLLLIGLCVLNYFFTVSGNAEGDALIAFKNALTDHTGVFTSWNASLVNPCSWFHITCNNENSVVRVDLGTASLSGRLVKQLGVLSNLQYLELYNNHISGTIPLELGNLSNLVSLDLYSNQLSGPIPDTLGKLSKLRFLRLNNNTLSGAIPYSLTAITSLQVLDFSNNNLSGVVPVNGSFSSFTPTSFQNNPHLYNSTILPPTQNPPPLPPPTTNPPPSEKGSEETRKRAAVVGFFLFSILSFSCTFCWREIPISATLAWWRRMRCQDPFFDVQAEEDAVFLCLGQLKRFSLRELLVATDNFSHKNVVGKGGFAKVYKGRLADGSLVAVKRLKEEHTRGGELQFLTEVEMISMAVHRNLLRLKGFCVTPTERLLVYPYMSNGSLASCLRACKESQPPLDWPKRKQIALGSATGLTYLHEHCDPKIIHRDVKAANILLDDKFEAVMGDFGLAKLMDYKDTHVITVVCGTTGHIAPEYLSMGKSSEKTDVFSYGVMLLELITGQRAFDLARLARKEGFMFLDWVKGLLKDERFESLVDANLQGKCPQEEVEELIQIALLCTQTSALQRPKMSEVVRLLEGEGLAERWEVSQEFRHELIDTCCHNKDFVVDSTGNLRPDQLSGPR